ncbi:MAG: DUF2127 domain-containing protein [Candidatus Pacearchaeota archaeon]|jgi:hypothetical protein
MIKKMPLGLKIISLIYILLVILSIALSIVSFIYPSVYSNIPNFNLEQYGQNIFISFGIFLLVLSLVFLIVLIGLLKHKNWARYSVLTISTIIIIGNILSVIEKDYIGIINLFVNLIIVIYLIFNKKIRKIFNKPPKITKKD